MTIVLTSGDETRKIQFTGKSTYIVSLPKQWITELGLKQGDRVSVDRKGVSSLQIMPWNTRRKDQSDTATKKLNLKKKHHL